MKSVIVDRYNRPITAYADVYEGARPSRLRAAAPRADRDSKQILTSWTRRQMLSVCRGLFANVGFVKGAVRDIARYSVGSGLIPQSQAQRREIRSAYEAYFREWSKIPETTNQHNYTEVNRLRSEAIDVDGEIGQVYTETPTGFPKIQLVEAHRIESNSNDDTFQDGIQTDDQGAHRRYSIRVGDDEFRTIGADNFALLVDRDRCDQLHGVTAFHHALNTLRDIAEILTAEKTSVKINSVLAMVIKIAKEEANSESGFFGQQGTRTVDGKEVNLDLMMSGAIPRLLPGEDIASHSSDRPSSTFMGFLDHLLRDVANGLGVPWEFVWDASKLGGSTNRLAIQKAQRKFEERQALLIKLCNRDWGYVIAKGVKRGDIPQDDDWWRVVWRTPRKITVDEGRDAKENRQDIFSGLRTMSEDYSERGMDWEDEGEQQDVEIDRLLERAQAHVKRHGISLDMALQLCRQTSPNPVAEAVKKPAT